jgi:large subunit ribosomal protein L24
MNIRKGDMVVVLAGKYKGVRGRILRVLRSEGRVLVEGVNFRKHHMRSQSSRQGGIVERESPITMSNVMPWCEAENRPSPIVMKRLGDGTRVRMYKINGETLND